MSSSCPKKSTYQHCGPNFDRARQLRRPGIRLLHHSGPSEANGRHENVIAKKMRDLLCTLPSPIKSQAGNTTAYDSTSSAESTAIATATNVQAVLTRRDAETSKQTIRRHSASQRNLHTTPNRASGLSFEQDISNDLTSTDRTKERASVNKTSSGPVFGRFDTSKASGLDGMQNSLLPKSRVQIVRALALALALQAKMTMRN